MATPKPQELFASINHRPPKKDWMDVPVEIKPGRYCYAANPKSLEIVGFPHAREWNPLDDDWKLPENWKEIIIQGIKER